MLNIDVEGTVTSSIVPQPLLAFFKVWEWPVDEAKYIQNNSLIKIVLLALSTVTLCFNYTHNLGTHH